MLTVGQENSKDELSVVTATADGLPKVQSDNNDNTSNRKAVTTQSCPRFSAFVTRMRKTRLVQNCVFVVSTVSLVLVAYCTLYIQWLLPYYYTCSWPLLMIYRAIVYTQNKWQYFMLDFCYFVNLYLLIFIWAVPGNEKAFAVLFAATNGPVGLATVIYRNSLVFHSTDKMTSCFIHIIPCLITFCIRWFPSTTSRYWYTPFTSNNDTSVQFMFIWLVVLGSAMFIAHSILYIILIQLIIRPGPDYDYSYVYLKNSDTIVGQVLKRCAFRHTLIAYTLLNWLYAIAAILFVPLLYKFYAAHCVFILTITIIVTWSGGRFYVEVFGPRQIESY